MSTSFAAVIAQDLLAHELPDRFAHVAHVAERAAEVCRDLGIQAEDIVSAAWLHDIGYTPAIAATGFHPLDGARFVKEAGLPAEVASLVAFHTKAEAEAEERGLLAELVGEFVPPQAENLDVLTYCDLTVGPQGQRMTVTDRLAEILDRYEPDDVVHRCTRRVKDELNALAGRVERQIADQSQ
jgi:putative nucleotidyltransferase with HDIG domain